MFVRRCCTYSVVSDQGKKRPGDLAGADQVTGECWEPLMTGQTERSQGLKKQIELAG